MKTPISINSNMKNSRKLLVFAAFVFLVYFCTYGENNNEGLKEAEAASVRKPVDVMLVIDRSESMGSGSGVEGQTKLDVTKSSALTFIDKLAALPPDATYGTSHQIGLSAFNSSSDTAYLSGDFARTRLKITGPDGYLGVAEGYKKAYLGVEAARDELSNPAIDSSVDKVMIIITDGLPSSSGGSDPAAIGRTLAAAETAKNNRVTVIAIGLDVGGGSGSSAFADYIRNISSPGYCFYVSSYFSEIANCNLIPPANLTNTLNQVYDTVTSSMFDETFPTINISRSPVGALFASDALKINANASDDVGLFKNLYVTWARSEEWSDASKRTRVDCSNLAGVTEADGRRHIYMSAGIPITLSEGQAIKYQATVTDASNNVVTVDAGGPRIATVASPSLNIPSLYRNRNNRIYLNISDPDGQAYFGNTFDITITSPDSSAKIEKVPMIKVENGNLLNPQYYYDFNPGCDWKRGYVQDGVNHQYLEDINVNVKISVNSIDVGRRDLISLSNQRLSSYFEGRTWPPESPGTTCSNGINDDCDYNLAGQGLVDGSELSCDGVVDSVNITRTDPSEEIGAEVYDSNSYITLRLDANDSSGLSRTAIYYRVAGSASWTTAYVCTDNNLDGKCDGDVSKNIDSFSININNIFPAAAGTQIEYKAEATDYSGNGNIGSSTVKSFTVKSRECDGRNNLDSCIVNTSGKCCGNVCNASASNASGYDASCTRQVCDGTVLRLVSDRNGATCTKEGNSSGCNSAAVPSLPQIPFNIPDFYTPSSPYSQSGCENRVYTCNNGFCNYSANGTRNDGCGAAGSMDFRDFECVSGVCVERNIWQDAVCDHIVDFANLEAFDANNVNVTRETEILDKLNGNSNQITLTASVADANGIGGYKLYWRINRASSDPSVWQSRDCGSCGPSGTSGICTCSQTIGPLSSGDFVSYYLWSQDNSPNHNVRINGANGLEYKYYSYNYSGTDYKGTFIGAGVDAALDHYWSSRIYVNNANAWESLNLATMTWEGFITPTSLGQYVFYASANDSTLVYLNGSSTPIINGTYWYASVGTFSSATSDITSAAQNITSLDPLPVLVKWHGGGTGGYLKLGWTPPGGTKVYPIPAANLISPYVIAVRDSSCYVINPDYSDPSTARPDTSVCGPSNNGICCGGYCTLTPPSSSFYSSECRQSSCSGLTWVYAPDLAKNNSSCGAAGSCFSYYNGCQPGNICSAGFCVPNSAGIQTDSCNDNSGSPSYFGNFLKDYSCSAGACSIVNNKDCSQRSGSACACSCNGYSNKAGSEKVYSSLKFDGIDDYVNLGNNSNLNGHNYSISMWAKMTSGSSDAGFISKGYDNGITLNTVGTNLMPYINKTSPNASYNNFFPLNQWIHFVLIVKDDTFNVYKNGVDINPSTGSETYGGGSLVNSYDFMVGRWSSVNYRYFAGYIDDLRIYNRVLSPEEIKDQYNGIYDNSAGDPLGYWDFDDGSGGVAKNKSAGGKDGYLSNVGILGGTGTGTAIPAWTSGRISSGLSFDGSNDYVALNDLSVSTSTNSKTSVEFWMKWNGNESNSPMPFGWNTYDLIFKSGSFGFSTSTSTSDVYGVSSSGLANKWVYVTAIFNNGDAKLSQLYLNGVKQNLTQRIGTTNLNRYVGSAASVSGWRYTQSYKFGGSIDEVRIYKRALSDTEAFQHYQGIYLDNNNLIGYWNFNENSGVYAGDSSGSSPQWARYYYKDDDSAIAGNVASLWKVCKDGGKDNDCDNSSDRMDLDCDGILNDASVVLKNSENQDDLLNYTNYAEIDDRQIKDVSKNFTIEGSASDDSGLAEITVSWSTDNWGSSSASKTCGQTNDASCRVCIQGGNCYNTDSGRVVSSSSNSITDDDIDSSKFWAYNEWQGGKIKITDGGRVEEFNIISNTSDTIVVSNWGAGGQPSGGTVYELSKKADIIDGNSIVGGGVLKIKTCARDRSTNANLGCTAEKVVSVLNSNNPPEVSGATVVTPSLCNGGLRYRFGWQFHDDDGDGQSSYTIQIKQNAVSSWDSVDSVVTINHPSDASSYEFNTSDFRNAAGDGYKFVPEYGSNTYNWRVKVMDNVEESYKKESEWMVGPDIVTPQYRYPQVDFTVDPNCVITESGGYFSDSGVPCSRGSEIKFNSFGLTSVFVECQPSNDYNCQTSKKVKCGAGNMCEGCSNSNECHGKLGSGWNCNAATKTCEQIPSFACSSGDTAANTCLAKDQSKCDETLDPPQCVPCTEDSQCKKFNTPDTYYCKNSSCVKRGTADSLCENNSSPVSCNIDDDCRSCNTGRDYVCSTDQATGQGICEDYKSREWFFGDPENVVGSSVANPTHVFTSPEKSIFSVRLKVQDYAGNYCYASKRITFEGKKYPKWNEVSSSDNYLR